MDFSKIKEIVIPEGRVTQITDGSGNILWRMWKETGLPSSYQEVEWIQAAANVGAYIDLGFSYDTGATIHLGQWIMNNNTAYPFGAAENSGNLRCMFSIPYDSNAYGYCSNATTFQAVSVIYRLNVLNSLAATYKGGSFLFGNMTTGKQGRYDEMASFTMSNSLYLFAQNYNGSPRFGDIRQISYFRYYDKTNTLICDLVPCYRKADGVIGMYDVVRRKFLTNVGSGSFTKGADVSYKNWVKYSTDEDGKTIYNGGSGYKNGYRVRSGGAEIGNESASCTGFIPVAAGDIVRLSGYDVKNVGVDNAINVSDASFTNLGQIVSNSSYSYGIFQGSGHNWDDVILEKDNVYYWVVPDDYGIAYIRVTGYTGGDGSKMIVTVQRGNNMQ